LVSGGLKWKTMESSPFAAVPRPRSGQRASHPPERKRDMSLCLEGEPRGHVLTPREREIANLVCHGLSNKEVGRRLDLREGTVKIHLHNIYKKIGVSNRTALTRWGLDATRQSTSASPSIRAIPISPNGRRVTALFHALFCAANGNEFS
jgi:DNA-binding CsgD family transcriptional regulator